MSSWHRPHRCMMSSLKPSTSARLIVWALWQSLQVGTTLSSSRPWRRWMLLSKTSWIPWWQLPQVSATRSGWTLEAVSLAGRAPWEVWQLVQVAVTTRPLSRRPLPWMLSV